MDDALVHREVANLVLPRRGTFWLGTPAAGATYVVMAWPHVPHARLIAWFLAVAVCGAAFALAMFPPLVHRRRRSDGLPALLPWVGVLTGIVYGALPWLFPESRVDFTLSLVMVAIVLAMSAGAQAGVLNGTTYPVFFHAPLIALASLGFLAPEVATPDDLHPGRVAAGVGLLIYYGFITKDGASSRRQMSAGVRAQLQASRSALTDPLTGLANRSGATRALEQWSTESGAPVTLLYIDLDRFKLINDRFGHATGDALLRQVAGRLTASVRPHDLVARLGGDEFVVVLREPDGPDGDDLGRRIIGNLEQPFWIDGRELSISACVGIASTAPGSTAAGALLIHADQAMYTAKRSGRRRAVTYHDGIGQDLDSRSAVEMDLRRALPTGQIRAYAQPVVELRTAAVAWVELLARWTTPAGASISPAVFVPQAEELGLARDLGRTMLAHAAHAMRVLDHSPQLAGISVSVNVSPAHAVDGLIHDITGAVSHSGLDPHRLIVEVTEGDSLPAGPDGRTGALQQLRTLGVRIAADDFGAGFSSTGALVDLPLDIVKLDRSLLASQRQRPGILHHVAGLAQALEQQVVAEGVETADDLRAVLTAGIHYGQGYGLCRPLPVDDLPDVVTAAQPDPVSRLITHDAQITA